MVDSYPMKHQIKGEYPNTILSTDESGKDM